jgi:hypothetical protein
MGNARNKMLDGQQRRGHAGLFGTAANCKIYQTDQLN